MALDFSSLLQLMGGGTPSSSSASTAPSSTAFSGSSPTAFSSNWLSGLSGMLGGLGPTLSGALSGQGINLGGLQIPTSVLGLAPLIAGLMQPNQTGASSDATQFLRNTFTSPTAVGDVLKNTVSGTTGALSPIFQPTAAKTFLTSEFTDPNFVASRMSGQLGALASNYTPLLDQQQNLILNDIQQRAIAGQPQGFSAAMSGPELGAMRMAAQNQLLPTRNAMLADLARELITRQEGAARTVLGDDARIQNAMAAAAMSNYGMQNQNAMELVKNASNPTADALTKLGIMMMLSNLMGGGQGGVGAINPGGVGAGGATTPLGGGPFPPGGIGGQNPLSGFLSSIGGGRLPLPLIGAVSDTAIAGGTGNLLGPNLPNQATGALAGAGAGATEGAAIGSIVPGLGPAIGALIGGASGGLEGFLGKRADQLQTKVQNLQADLSSQANQVAQIGNFFGTAFAAAGVDPTAFQQFVSEQMAISAQGPEAFSFGGVSDTQDQQLAVAEVGGRLLLQAIQAKNPSITSLDQVPGLRASFIQFLTQHTGSAPDSSYAGGPPVDQFSAWANLAGL